MAERYVQQELFEAPLPGEDRAGDAPPGTGNVAPLPGTAGLEPEYRLLNPEDIQADPGQPRRSFDQRGLLELAASIARVGLIEPLIVEERDAGRGLPYTLVAGERRHRAMLLGRRLWPGNPHFAAARCLVYPPLPPAVRAALRLEENARRRGLDPYEVAAGLAAFRLGMAASAGPGGPPPWERVLEMLGFGGRKEVLRWLRRP
ncbi:ParB/RepB/Spo0J family partition protein [Ammonifex thiophilus]|uniref:ParB/RepB/Spo0J family partition protein n=1 Tax=Ammonifex thiophilus TaxID=444093 RepID=UPI00196B2209|nr:ParB N-terminal domain-containing protein [Ammonifex thiophilus]